jgi:histidine triad (HIT) family protein
MKALLFNFARLRLFSWVVPLAIPVMNFLIQAEKIYESGTLLAFYHPQPSYPVHILIVPKKAIASLAEIRDEDQEFMRDLFRCIRILVNDLSLNEPGYRLISNGGKFQEIPQLHFHLVSEKPTY